MKSLTNILRRSDITPLERVTALVHNDVYKEKNGKNALSDSDIFVLTKSWNPRASEALEYNKYINIVQLEDSMKIDAQMFLFTSELSLIRNQRVLDYDIFNNKMFKNLSNQEFIKDVSKEESIKLLTQSTYFEYQKLLHIFTFNNLPKEIQDDLLLLDEVVTSDKKYLEDQVFLYEKFKDGNELSQQDKDLIISHIYTFIYHEGIKKIRQNATEKDGFLLYSFFAELTVKDILKKLIIYSHIPYGGVEDNLLSAIEEYAQSKNVSIESLIKEMISCWLDDGLFVNDYQPLYISERYDTWNGDTKNNHKELFMAWYTELQKTKQFFQKLLDSGKLVKQNIEKDFLEISKTVEVITGDSLYKCKEDISFEKDYKEQIEILLPLANMFLFVKKHATPVKNYKTLCEFRNLAQKLSIIFNIDMTERYCEFIKLYKEEIYLFNHSLNRFTEKTIEYLYSEKSLLYIVDIIEDNFIFDLNADDSIAKIVESYSVEFEKMEK
jgi:hypothetical protein